MRCQIRKMGQMNRPCRMVVLMVAVLLSATNVFAGKLSDTSSVVDDDDDDDDDDEPSFCFLCFLFSGRDNAADQDVELDETEGPDIERDSRFLRYPYARGQQGYSIVYEARYEVVVDAESHESTRQMVSEQTRPSSLQLHDGRSFAFRAVGAYQYDWDQVHLTDVRLAMDAASGFGVQLRWTEFMEPVAGDLDLLTLVDVMLRGAIVTAHQGLFHLGVGGLLMHYNDDTRVGAYGAFQVRLFPLRPMVMGLDLQLGYLNKAAYIRGELTAGVIFGPIEIFASYGTQMFLGDGDAVFYHGPGGGLRFWF